MAPKTLLEVKARALWQAWVLQQMWLFDHRPTTGTAIPPIVRENHD